MLRGLIVLVLVVVGILGIVAGVLYLTETAHALPSFLPGHSLHATYKHTKRGDVAVAVGAVLVIIGVAFALTGRRRRGVFR